jgi:hypothetical protein
MTDRILIRRSEVNPPYVPREPLTWGPDDGYKAFVVCVNGHPAGLPDHDIDANGNVSPSILCRTPMGPDAAEGSNYYSPTARECGWHVFATLDGWGG